jgi:16S rRNA (guanine527-N7)-methyltransferase
LAYNLLVLSQDDVRELLVPFDVPLTDSQIAQLLAYLDLLLRWNQKINLTAIRTPTDCVTRHFGESFYLTRLTKVEGRLLDIGSGAGFPGLALKILCPSLTVTLLEPVAKKRAFLKEVARTCGMNDVEATGHRAEEFSARFGDTAYDIVTMRAVGEPEKTATLSARFLKPGGRLCLWLGKDQAASVQTEGRGVLWEVLHPIPLSKQRLILIGTIGIGNSVSPG